MRLEGGSPRTSDFERYVGLVREGSLVSAISGADLHHDTAGLSVLELRAKARPLKRDPANKLGLVLVDYVQLMQSSEGRDNREQGSRRHPAR